MTLGLMVLGVVAVTGYAAKDDIELVSRASGANGTKGDSFSGRPAISADGRYIAFESSATNLDPAASDDSTGDVFVRDRQTNTTTLVSRAADGTEADGSSFHPALSADGRYVTFTSFATNLDSADTDDTSDVFVRDLRTDTTTLVSRADGPNGGKGNANAFSPAISGDGQHISFESFATNLDANDVDDVQDVFVRDLQANTTVLVTQSNGTAANEDSLESALSADGRYITFSSFATNLDPDDDDGLRDVFVRDRQANTTSLVSRADGADGARGSTTSIEPAISADGRYVTFRSFATNLDPDDDDDASDVFVRDRQADTTALVSRASGADGMKADNSSFEPAISAAGRHITFGSFGQLASGDSNTVADVFVRDLQTNATTLVSRASGSGGTAGNGGSADTAISSDGRFITFESAASNLDPDDTDDTHDVFVRDVLGPPPAAPPGTPTQCPAGTSPTVRCLRDAKGRLAMEGTGADETFIGTNGRDRISPRGGNDVVFANGAKDLISGGRGNDELHGGPGNDRMNGNAGNDRISGNRGNDRISGRSGRDRLSGQAGRDRLRGGSGNDSISGGPGPDRFHCGTGTDTAHTTPRDNVDDSCRDG